MLFNLDFDYTLVTITQRMYKLGKTRICSCQYNKQPICIPLPFNIDDVVVRTKFKDGSYHTYKIECFETIFKQTLTIYNSIANNKLAEVLAVANLNKQLITDKHNNESSATITDIEKTLNKNTYTPEEQSKLLNLRSKIQTYKNRYYMYKGLKDNKHLINTFNKICTMSEEIKSITNNMGKITEFIKLEALYISSLTLTMVTSDINE